MKNALVAAYGDALALVRAAVNGDHDMAAEMVTTLTNRELTHVLTATAALAAVLAEETSKQIGIPVDDLMRDLMQPHADTP